MADAGFPEHCRELLEGIGPVRLRRMFGGHGLYAGDVMVALIAADTLFLRVDDQTRAAFEAAGGSAFVYDAGPSGKPVAMPYLTVPEGAMDDPAAMAPWAERALAAARRAKAAKRPKRAAAG